MDTFFSIVGKLVLVVLLLGAVSYGAYSIGKQSQVSKPGAVSTTVVPTPTVPAPTPYIVTAGLDASSGLSFTKYQITAPEGWTPHHVTTNEGTWVDTLTLTKEASQLKMFQAATGGAICLYPTDTPMEGPSSTYDTYVEITTQTGQVMRRSTTTATSGTTKGYTICMKSSYGNFQQPTIFGHMSLTTPLNPDAIFLSEVDAMIASLKKL